MIFPFFDPLKTSMTSQLKIALASLAFAASGVASAQTLLNGSYDVAREFYKDYNAAFIAQYKKPPAKTSRLTSRTLAPAPWRALWPMAWTPMW